MVCRFKRTVLSSELVSPWSKHAQLLENVYFQESSDFHYGFCFSLGSHVLSFAINDQMNSYHGRKNLSRGFG